MRAITEAEFLKRERVRRGDASTSSGASVAIGSRHSPLTVVSDSDSDGPLVPLIQRQKRPHNMALPFQEQSDSDNSQSHQDLKVAKLFMEVKEDLESAHLWEINPQ